MPRKMLYGRTAGHVLALLAVGSLLTGCVDQTAVGTPSPTPTATAPDPLPTPDTPARITPIAAGVRNLNLDIGTIPRSIHENQFDASQRAGIQLAVNDINSLNLGVKARIVTPAVALDAVDPVGDAVAALTDPQSTSTPPVIIGTFASALPPSLLTSIKESGAMLFTRAAPERAKTLGAPVDSNRFFSPTASDRSEATKLAKLLSDHGAKTLGLLTLSDSYGSSLGNSIESAFKRTGGEVTAHEVFNPGERTFDSPVSILAAAKPDAIAIASNAEAKLLVPALIGAGYPAKNIYLINGNVSDYSNDFTPGLTNRMNGIAPVATPGFNARLATVDPTLITTQFAAEAYDSVMLAALAAYAGNSTDPVVMAQYVRQISGTTTKLRSDGLPIPTVSTPPTATQPITSPDSTDPSGAAAGPGDEITVTTFAAAIAVMSRGQNIDYDGASGPLTLTSTGEAADEYLGVFQYGPENKAAQVQ